MIDRRKYGYMIVHSFVCFTSFTTQITTLIQELSNIIFGFMNTKSSHHHHHHNTSNTINSQTSIDMIMLRIGC